MKKLAWMLPVSIASALFAAIPPAAATPGIEPQQPDEVPGLPAPTVAPPPVSLRSAPAPDVAQPSGRWPRQPTRIDFGLRTLFVADGGIDPYASQDALPQLALSASHDMLRVGRVALAAVAEWDLGATGATARSEPTGLLMNRIAIGAEARLALARTLVGFIRVAPGANWVHAKIADGFDPLPLEADGWAFGLDTTVGAAVRLAGNASESTSGFWFVGETGYAFADGAPMQFVRGVDVTEPRRYGALTMPDVRLQGPLLRLAVALSF